MRMVPDRPVLGGVVAQHHQHAGRVAVLRREHVRERGGPQRHARAHDLGDARLSAQRRLQAPQGGRVGRDALPFEQQLGGAAHAGREAGVDRVGGGARARVHRQAAGEAGPEGRLAQAGGGGQQQAHRQHGRHERHRRAAQQAQRRRRPVGVPDRAGPAAGHAPPGDRQQGRHQRERHDHPDQGGHGQPGAERAEEVDPAHQERRRPGRTVMPAVATIGA